MSRITICSSPSNLVSSKVSIGKNSSVGPPLTNVSVPLVGVNSSPAIAFDRSVREVDADLGRVGGTHRPVQLDTDVTGGPLVDERVLPTRSCTASAGGAATP